MMSMSASRFDISRFGAEVFRGSPRQSDLMIIAGRVSNKMAPGHPASLSADAGAEVGHLHGRMRDSTGVFNNYALVPVNQVIPVDVFVPGCRRARQFIHAIMILQAKIGGSAGAFREALNIG